MSWLLLKWKALSPHARYTLVKDTLLALALIALCWHFYHKGIAHQQSKQVEQTTKEDVKHVEDMVNSGDNAGLRADILKRVGK